MGKKTFGLISLETKAYPLQKNNEASSMLEQRQNITRFEG